jgi:DNA ligase 1
VDIAPAPESAPDHARPATLLAELVAVSSAVAATAKRSEKARLLAGVLVRLASADIAVAVGALIGEARQGRIGLGWAALNSTQAVPDHPGGILTIAELDHFLTAVDGTTGPGSVARRRLLVDGLAEQSSPSEFEFVRRLCFGEVRHGALGGVMTEAIAKAGGVAVDEVRRAAMMLGDLGQTAVIALTGGGDALRRVGLIVGRPIGPMLASSAPTVAEALAATGIASVEYKLDGARIQVHRDGDDVRIFTRNLNEITERLPGVVAAVSAFPARRFVLDGEVIGLGGDGRPQAFQDTMSDFGAEHAPATELRAFFFDVIHLDGRDLLDEPLTVRRGALGALAGASVIPSLVTNDDAAAERFADEAIACGHEGVVVKAMTSVYAAGRRGSGWIKVKPVHTFDLVVLAAEWGHGRRRGWLSNLHLGARHPSDETRFVMVGKTFKGLTDDLLAWQTDELQRLATHRDEYTVYVEPKLVVEVAIDGVQRSSRYPGGIALRFARVRRYRPDKSAAEADAVTSLQTLNAAPPPQA